VVGGEVVVVAGAVVLGDEQPALTTSRAMTHSINPK
jgi:hypothetical protein